jgi:hypothetical protein
VLAPTVWLPQRHFPPSKLVPAMAVSIKVIMPTPPIAPLWPPPTTMPATICGSRTELTPNMCGLRLKDRLSAWGNSEVSRDVLSNELSFA